MDCRNDLCHLFPMFHCLQVHFYSIALSSCVARLEVQARVPPVEHLFDCGVNQQSQSMVLRGNAYKGKGKGKGKGEGEGHLQRMLSIRVEKSNDRRLFAATHASTLAHESIGEV